MLKYWKMALIGACAGAVAGLFSAGGGMVLVPLLTALSDIDDDNIFPASVSIILPICIISLIFTFEPGLLQWQDVLPYLLGSAIGGVAAGFLARKIPTIWLHRSLGLLIIWGGIRYIC